MARGIARKATSFGQMFVLVLSVFLTFFTFYLDLKNNRFLGTHVKYVKLDPCKFTTKKTGYM